MTPKYAPAREDGAKPYVVTVWDMGREYTTVVHADSAPQAKSVAVGRRGPGRYAKPARRATPTDMEEERDG